MKRPNSEKCPRECARHETGRPVIHSPHDDRQSTPCGVSDQLASPHEPGGNADNPVIASPATDHISSPAALSCALSDRPSDRPTAEMSPDDLAKCLVEKVPKLYGYLRGRGFAPFVAERACDRVVRAALPHVLGHAACQLRTHEDRRRWLFRSGDYAAEQLARLEPRRLAALPQCEAPRRLPDRVVDALYDALDRLTDRQAAAVWLCTMTGRSLAEAAREMGCVNSKGEPKTSLVQRHRDAGLRKLKKLLPPWINETTLLAGTDVQ